MGGQGANENGGGDIIFNNCLCDLLIQVHGVLASGEGGWWSGYLSWGGELVMSTREGSGGRGSSKVVGRVGVGSWLNIFSHLFLSTD